MILRSVYLDGTAGHDCVFTGCAISLDGMNIPTPPPEEFEVLELGDSE